MKNIVEFLLFLNTAMAHVFLIFVFYFPAYPVLKNWTFGNARFFDRSKFKHKPRCYCWRASAFVYMLIWAKKLGCRVKVLPGISFFGNFNIVSLRPTKCALEYAVANLATLLDTRKFRLKKIVPFGNATLNSWCIQQQCGCCTSKISIITLVQLKLSPTEDASLLTFV